MKLHKSDLELETIVNRINAGELDLQPNFQRGEIWDLKRKQRLIDTILRAWYVPAVHIVVDSEENDLVLDGQQRFATIRSFFNDEFIVDGGTEPDSEEIRSLHGMRYSELPALVRRRINRFVVPIVTLRDYAPDEPNELFFRLNQSYNLTPPEKRNALHSHARDQVKELVAQLGDVGLLQHDTVGFNNRRLAYDDIVARVCVAIEQNNLRTHINNSVVEDHYRRGEFSKSTIDSVRNSGIRLNELQRPDQLKLRFNKGTLQTWLVYCHWSYLSAGTSVIPPLILAGFEELRYSIKRGESDREDSLVQPLRVVMQIYDDRASYRVTDVTSVLARDLALHIFSMQMFQTPSRKGSDQLLADLRVAPSDQQQTRIFDFIRDSEWGDPLVGAGG